MNLRTRHWRVLDMQCKKIPMHLLILYEFPGTSAVLALLRLTGHNFYHMIDTNKLTVNNEIKFSAEDFQLYGMGISTIRL